MIKLNIGNCSAVKKELVARVYFRRFFMSDIKDNEGQENKSLENEKDKVSYETYQRTLKQLKENQNRMKELEEKQKEYEEKLKVEEEIKLKEQQKWKEIAERKEAEIKKEREKIVFLEKKHTNTIKERAFKDALGVEVKSKYLAFVDFDEISIDEKGEVDKITLENAIRTFKEENPELLPQKETKNSESGAQGKKENKSASLPQNKANDVNVNLQDIKNMSPAQLLELYKKTMKGK